MPYSNPAKRLEYHVTNQVQKRSQITANEVRYVHNKIWMRKYGRNGHRWDAIKSPAMNQNTHDYLCLRTREICRSWRFYTRDVYFRHL